MRALDRKLIRDFRRLWAQSLAIALVMACGVATLILAIGTYQSLDETRSAYYERYRFGDIFATRDAGAQCAGAQIAAIDGVAAVETRIASPVHPRYSRPARAGHGPGDLDSRERRHRGQRPVPAPRAPAGRRRAATRWRSTGTSPRRTTSPSDRPFEAVVNGSKIELTIVGIVLSPEYIYALGPGDMMPDNRRFGVLWMQEKVLAPLFNLDGAFNSVSLRLLPGASESSVIEALDRLLEPYGGTGAYARKDQLSNAFLDSELVQLKGMAEIIPPIFLAVSAFLINMILSRLISLEREQIGLLKALGYGRFAVVWHYLKLVLAIAAIGTLIGIVARHLARPRPDAHLCRVLQLPLPHLPRDAGHLSGRRRHQLRRGDPGRAAARCRTAFALPAGGRHAPAGAAGLSASTLGGLFARPAHLLAAHHHGAPPCHAPSGALDAHRRRHRLLGGAGRGGAGHDGFGRRHARRDLLPHRPAGRDAGLQLAAPAGGGDRGR